MFDPFFIYFPLHFQLKKTSVSTSKNQKIKVRWRVRSSAARWIRQETYRKFIKKTSQTPPKNEPKTAPRCLQKADPPGFWCVLAAEKPQEAPKAALEVPKKPPRPPQIRPQEAPKQQTGASWPPRNPKRRPRRPKSSPRGRQMWYLLRAF